MKRITLTLSILLLATITSATVSQAQERPLLRNPTMSKTQIVFVYAGDLWIVPRAGGEAARLTTGVGTETDPLFSPDGTKVAFTAQYDGNKDVYLVPTTGGVPKRLTYHPADDEVVSWSPDGKSIVFVSGRDSYSRFKRLFTMAVDGTVPTPIPVPMGYEGSFSADGTRLAYVPIVRSFEMWKRYRGGRTTPIWIANLSDSSIERVPRDNSNDYAPMWLGDKVYFLSDRNGAAALFAYDLKTKKVAQALPNTGLDIKSASAYHDAAGDAVVYEQFGSINVFDVKTSQTKPVNITINGDLPSVRARYEKVGPRIAPQYRYNNNQPPVITGYQANNQLTVRFRDMARSGAILDALVKEGANEINGPTMMIDNPEAATDEARIAAVKSARARAEIYAGATGLKIKRIVSIIEGEPASGHPVPMMMAKAAISDAAETTIMPGEQNVGVTVSVVFELQ